MNKIYNAAVFMPGQLIARVQEMSLRLAFSAHAKAALLDDRYGTLPPGSVSKDFHGRDWQLVEAETSSSGILDKIVVRRTVDNTRDLVLVIFPTTGHVGTCWINQTSDTHYTLDKRRFATTF